MRTEKTEKMMVELINDITSTMAGTLSNEELNKLKNVLYMKMNGYNIDKPCTDIVVYDTTNDKVLGLFLSTKSVEGKSSRTINRYRDILSAVLHGINKPIKEITTWDLRTYLAIYKETRHVCDNTLDGMRRIITSFFGWLHTEKYLMDDPSARLQKIKVEKKVKTVLTEEDVEKLRIACSNNRDIAIIDLLYTSGMRVGELSNLNISDIDLENKAVIVHGKGNKQRQVFFNGSTKVRLEKYISSRKDSNPALFVTLHNSAFNSEPVRVNVKTVETRVNVIAAHAGLKNVYPHKFRRSMATNMANKNVPVSKISYLLGHEKISTTQSYLVNNKVDVENSYRLCFE